MWTEKHGKTWRVREVINGKKITLASGYPTKTAANKAKTLMTADALRGDALVPRGRDKTVRELADMWWAEIGPTFGRIKTEESMRGVLDRYVVRLLADHTLGFLEDNPSVVQNWVNDLSAGRTKPRRGAPRPLAPKTVRNAHGLLSQVLGWAVQRKLIRANPCEATRLPDEVYKEHYYLTPAEADRLIAALPPFWRPLVLFLLATGCRWSEALGVRAKHLVTIANKVTFLKKWIEDEHGHFHEEDIKSRRGRRPVSLLPRVVEALVPLIMAGEGDRERHIFRAPRGGDIRHKEFYAVWHRATEAAGLKGLRVHDLRHTHVAWLIAGGVAMSAISRRLGHKSYAITDGTYGHLLEEVDVALIATLEQAMSVIDFGGIVGEMTPAETRRATLHPALTAA